MTSQLTILAFDTSAAHCAAALLLNGTVIARVEPMVKGQGERIMVLLEEVLAEAGLAWSDLDAIGVGVGPGNFTGIRISVSAARGLALGLGIPAVGVSMFQTTQRLGKCRAAAVPAPRDQVYYFDPDTMHDPVLTTLSISQGAVTVSADYSTSDHVCAIAEIAAQTAIHDTPRPAPLYVKPPDAAPSRDAPPLILP